MKKRNLIPIFVFIFLSLINFTSAYYYGTPSISNFLNSIDESTAILGSIFIISFFFVNFSLSRTFKDKWGNPNKGIWIPALAVALLLTWGINKVGFDAGWIFQSLGWIFQNTGIPSSVWYTLAPLILLVLVILIWRKLGARILLIVLGGLFIAISFLTYEKIIPIIIGICLILIGFFVMKRRRQQSS